MPPQSVELLSIIFPLVLADSTCAVKTQSDIVPNSGCLNNQGTSTLTVYFDQDMPFTQLTMVASYIISASSNNQSLAATYTKQELTLSKYSGDMSIHDVSSFNKGAASEYHKSKRGQYLLIFPYGSISFDANSIFVFDSAFHALSFECPD